MGFALLLVLAGATLGAMALLGVPKRLWSSVAAAVMLGAAGYALQGSPGRPASPAKPPAERLREDAGLTDLRDRLFERFTLDAAYLIAADAMMRNGDERSAVRALLGGINKIPRSLSLWTALGTALAAHDGDTVSPPALFAFQQAMRIAPRHPAPPFFLGLAHVRAGEYPAARPFWARAVAVSPEGASYRRDIALRLALLDRVIADQDRPARPR